MESSPRLETYHLSNPLFVLLVSLIHRSEANLVRVHLGTKERGMTWKEKRIYNKCQITSVIMEVN